MELYYSFLIHKIPQKDFILSQMNPIHTLTLHSLQVNFITFPSTASLIIAFFHQDFINVMCMSHLPVCATRLANLISQVIFGEKHTFRI
jgi:maltodextrin utilization protein YvdJ